MPEHGQAGEDDEERHEEDGQAGEEDEERQEDEDLCHARPVQPHFLPVSGDWTLPAIAGILDLY